ncbi:MAG: hypothetical protein MJZ26_02090 [Fibrobacter sp.]|nr:hypothetical protein [Fibrobacter sp.]
MSFKKMNFGALTFTAIALSLLIGCGDDSSANPQIPSESNQSTSAEEGAFRVARPAKYETKDGINYFTYYWGKCTIVNGVYSWNPMGDDNIYAYTISADSMKVYYRSTEEYENSSPLDPDIDFFMFGGNNDGSIWGSWNSVHCGIRNGVYTCGKAQLFNMAYEFMQDSVISYMTIDPNYVFINEMMHDILETYFNICPYDYNEGSDSEYPQDIPQKDVAFSNLTKNTGTLTIGGQNIDVEAYGTTRINEARYSFKVSSNGVTCSNETTFGYVNKPEFCSEAYRAYLTNNYLEMNATDTTETFYLRGRGNEKEYKDCLAGLFANNPAYKPRND